MPEWWLLQYISHIFVYKRIYGYVYEWHIRKMWKTDTNAIGNCIEKHEILYA